MNPRQIILVGPSGSGKATVAESVGRELRLPVISMDAFRRKGYQQCFVEHRGKQVRNFEDPRLWDANAIACKLRACIAAGTGFIAEGNHLLAYREIAALPRIERYYLDVPHHVSVRRRQTRHRYLPADESFIAIGEQQTALHVTPQLALPGVVRLDGTAKVSLTAEAIIHSAFNAVPQITK